MTNLSAHAIAIGAVAGFLAGMHAAIWGMYKDALYEGFATDRFLRSVILGALCGAGVQMLLRLPLPDMGSFVVLFGLAYASERGIVEVWKTFLREEDQSKYTIPTRLTIRGEPVRSRLHYTFLEELDRYSLLEIDLETGRTHQIRVHLAAVGMPLVGDPLYGVPGDSYVSCIEKLDEADIKRIMRDNALELINR